MEQHVAAHCKESTAEGVRQLLDKHILPEFGKLPLVAVKREGVAAFHARLGGVPHAANRAVALMSRMYGIAVDWEKVPDGTNCSSGRANRSVAARAHGEMHDRQSRLVARDTEGHDNVPFGRATRMSPEHAGDCCVLQVRHTRLTTHTTLPRMCASWTRHEYGA